MVEFKESKFYKLLQDFFINNDKETFIQFLAEFYNKTEGIIDKNNIQDEIIKELREMYIKFNEEGIDENIVREKVNYFVENNEKIQDIITKIIKNKNNIENITSQLDDITNGTVIIKTNGVDDSEVIQSSLNDGYNVILKGDIHTSKKIVISNPNQSIIQDYGTWYVHHVNDNAIHVLSYNNKIKCNFSGINQTVGNYNKSCIVVGQGGTEGAEKGRNCDLSFTQIKNYKGNGIRWINGARINLFYTEIFECNGHGFLGDIGCKDNNDGNFDNLTVVNCTGYGVYLKKYNQEQVASDVITDSAGSRQSGNNTFRNTKCFGNNINFVIETNQNTGTIFSEDKTGEYDVFSGDRNTIKYLGDIEQSNNFRNTGNNEIEFEDSFHDTNRNNFRTKKLTIADTFSGYNELYQEGNNSFVDTIKDTYSEVIVRHEKGTASSRTDTFDKIKIGDCFMNCIANQKISISEAITIESGGYYKLDTNISVPASINSIVKTFVQMNKNDDLIVSIVANRTDSGWYHPYITLYNPTNRTISLSTGTTFDFVAFS